MTQAERVLDILRGAAEDVTMDDLAAATGFSRQQVLNALHQLGSAVEVVERGKRYKMRAETDEPRTLAVLGVEEGTGILLARDENGNLYEVAPI